MEEGRRKQLQNLEKRVLYSFGNKELLNRALTHRSYSHEKTHRPEDNECLEFLGDAVLGLIISHLLFSRYQTYEEGALSQLKASLVSESQLAQLAKKLGLGKYLFLGRGEELSGGRAKSSILADTYEALLAALYLDGGIEPAYKLVEKHFLPLLPDSISKELLLDYKSRLQEYTQEDFKAIPEYVILKESGPEHRKQFTVGIRLNGKIMARGSGKSKKIAEQKAAKAALKKITAEKKEPNTII